MRRMLSGRRPSGAMIIASLALIIAMGGTAVAVVGLNAKEKKQVKRITIGLIRKAGVTGAPGAAGAPGTARAYGRVDSAGNLDTSRSKNVASAAHVGAANSGDYCITLATGIDPATTSPVATIDHTGASGDALATVRSSAAGCVASQLEIRTSSAAGGNSDQPFFFVVP